MEKALESLESIIDVHVEVSENSYLYGDDVYTTSGTISKSKTFYVHFLQLEENIVYNVPGGLETRDIPNLLIDQSRISGVPTRDSALLPEYQAKVTEVVKGVEQNHGGIVNVAISTNAVDFFVSGMVFEYYPVMRVNSLSPNHGPLFGGTEVHVKGLNFVKSSLLVCLFGFSNSTTLVGSSNNLYAVPISKFIGSDEIICKSPPSLRPQTIDVVVTLNTKDYIDRTDVAQQFRYDEPILLHEIIPRTGPERGDVNVKVYGEHFMSDGIFQCRFGNITVEAEFVSSHQINCIAPSQENGIYTFDITQNGQDFTSSGHGFEYYRDIKLDSIYPVAGPTVLSGTSISIFGSGFKNSTSLFCRFHFTEIAAEYVNENKILCKSPELMRTGKSLKWLDLSKQSSRISEDFGDVPMLFPGAHYYPLYSSSPVQVEVTNNGQDYTNSGIVFLYQKDIIVSGITNNHGPSWGGTPVLISGSSFVNTTDLSCRIGHHVSRGVFLTTEVMMCFSPPQSTTESLHGYLQHKTLNNNTNISYAPAYLIRPKDSPPSVLYIEVSNNGIDFTNFKNIFTYSNPVSNGVYQAGVDNQTLLMCPRGSYCKDGGQSNFTLCPKGTYQPMRGKETCIRCPIGYMCPEEGLPMPRICPAGYVCDVEGTERAEQPCPQGHFCLEGTATTATYCSPELSNDIVSIFSHTRSSSTISFQDSEEERQFSLGARNSVCWDNSTSDFGLQASSLPSRFWSERHILPLDGDAPILPSRGRFCLDDSCVRVDSSDDLNLPGSASFDYSSTSFTRRRPVPCPKGKYCHPGTAASDAVRDDFTTPQPCFESMYCPEGSHSPNGMGECPKGYYCPFSEKIPCPVGTFCPNVGNIDPIPCKPGYFNLMVAQFECSICPIGYICPGYGRVDPVSCPPGYVCSKEGLPSPNIRCPAGFYCPSGTQTSDPFRNDTTLRPYPCTPGTYCLSGTGYADVLVGDFLYAQPCTEGFFCEAASTSAKGSGLCPPGFYCPAGTANPVPTPKGFFAEFHGTVQPAACLPGFYAPTIQTTECYPCPPGTKCDVEGLFEAEICPPGTYRGLLEVDGQNCIACPQGSWSKNWQLREKGECTKCPTGVTCQLDGMTNPCSYSDLPQLFEPVVNVDGLPVPEYHFPLYNMPRYFSLDECLSMNPSTGDKELDSKNKKFFFGEVIPPYIDILGRGAHFRSSNDESLKYSETAKCFRNNNQYGTALYRRLADYFGPQFDIQTGNPHQGYGNSKLLNSMYAVSPPPGYDISLRYFHGEGVMNIDLPYARVFDPTYNCSKGFWQMNSTLVQDRAKIVYTRPEVDNEGGVDIEKCPVYDEALECYIDPTFVLHEEGSCCFVEPGQQRAIPKAYDQYYPGTCEADIICAEKSTSEADPCDDGYVCDEYTAGYNGRKFPCREGYFCDFGTTPDPSLESPQGQFKNICPSGYVCGDGTGLRYKDVKCPQGYFCPTGTADPLTGAFADDAMNRNISEFDTNPYEGMYHLVYRDQAAFEILGHHDISCLGGLETSLKQRYKLEWRSDDEDILNPYVEYLSVGALSSDSDMPYVFDQNITKRSEYVRPKVVNEATKNLQSCARDNKWKFIKDAITRQECDCNSFFFTVIAVYRLWLCTSVDPLEDLGLSALIESEGGKGNRDFWFSRIHHNFDLAMEINVTSIDNGLRWGDGSVCSWPDADVLTMTQGRIPYVGEHFNDGYGGRYISNVPKQGILPNSRGLLQIMNKSIDKEFNANFSIQFEENDIMSFKDYGDLKSFVEVSYRNQSANPMVFDLHKAVRLIEEFGRELENLIYFREKGILDDDALVFEIGHSTTSSKISLVPGRVDACECQNVFKCPNGTTSNLGSTDISDCKNYDGQVLRRVSAIPPADWKNHSKVLNGTDFSDLGGKGNYSIGTLELKALEVAIFTLNLTGLANNFTYNDHYKVSVYEDCKPCPPTYQCGTKDSKTCSKPMESQYNMLNECLRKNRRNVCVHSNGTTVDYQSCKRLYDKAESDRDKRLFDSTYIIFTEPDLHKCLSKPYFCDNHDWNYRTFRRVCQDRVNGKKGKFYDCSQVDRYDEYVQWQDKLCCVAEDLTALGACVDNRCSTDPSISKIISQKYKEKFISDHGFIPPSSRPSGKFVMNRDVQEDIENPFPFDLFNEWSSKQENPFLKPHNEDDPDKSLPWTKTLGCCNCKPLDMPSYFEKKLSDSGFPDNKHQVVQLSITALDSVNLTVAIELLHGLYYPEFDEYFGSGKRSKMYIHSPRRLSYEMAAENDSRPAWLAVIEQSDFSRIPLELPLNLPHKVAESKVLLDRPTKVEVGEKSLLGKMNQEGGMTYGRITLPYPIRDSFEDVARSELWWNAKNKGIGNTHNDLYSFLALPYFPFFSNCDGYDSHMSITRLLEEHPDCQIVEWNNTKAVSPYPWNDALSSLSDVCRQRVLESRFQNGEISEEMYRGIDLSCLYEEEVEFPSRRTRWFESDPETTLFYITRQPTPAEHFQSHTHIDPDNGKEGKYSWGRTPELDSIRESYKLIPVVVDEVMGGLRNTIPRRIQFDLEYYQVTQGTKRLVNADISFSDHCTTIKPVHFGGNKKLLDLMHSRGIPPCDVDINGKIKSFGYNLEVHFYPLDWFNLLNDFQFEWDVYFIFFTLVGIISVAMISLVWLLNRLLTKLRYPPEFHGWILAKLISGPAWFGCLLAAVPYTISLYVIHLWFTTNGIFVSENPIENPSIFSFEGVHGNWFDTGAFDIESIEKYRTGRIGVALLAVGIYTSSLCVSFVIPDLSKTDLKENEDETSNTKDDDSESESKSQDSDSSVVWKRAHLLLVSLCVECLLMWLLEFSYSDVFESNVYMYLALFKVLQILVQFFVEELLKEHLMVAPLIVVMHVAESLITMGAADFVEFTLTHFVGLSIIVIQRLYIYPWLKKMRNLVPRWKMILQRRLSKRKRLTRLQKLEAETKWRKVNEEIELRNEGVEPLLDSYSVYSIEIAGSIIVPIVFLFIMGFSSETEIPSNYHILSNEMIYYTMFAAYIIPWNSIVDVFILNSQELIHGWRLYDYMAYQRYRFATREYRWIMNSKIMDESISEGMQTLDLMGFSSQYYFILALFALGMFNNIFSVTIFLRTEYNFLGDPVMPIIMISMFMICDLIKICIQKLSDVKIRSLQWDGLWVTKNIEGTMDDEIAAKLAIGEGRELDLEQERLELQALNSDGFRYRFLEKNRPWLLQHLVDLITPPSLETVGPDGRRLSEYVRDVYADLTAQGEGARKTGDRSDISSDEGDLEEQEKRRSWSRKALEGSSLVMAKKWLHKARKRRSFGKCVASIIQGHKKGHCSVCSKLEDKVGHLISGLSMNGIYDPYALDSIISSFEKTYSENENDPTLWKSYFKKKADFITICNLCTDKLDKAKIEEKVSGTPGVNRPTRPGDISSDDEEDDVTFDLLVIGRTSNEGKMLGKWLEAARKKIGGEFPRPHAEEQMKQYVERMKKSKLKKAFEHEGSKNGDITKTDNKRIPPENIERENWAPVEMSETSKALAVRWVRQARESAMKRFQIQGNALREKIKDTLKNMLPEDDWFFGLELRKQGEELVQEGEKLTYDYKSKEAETNVKLRRLNSELDSFKQEVEAKLSRKRDEIKHVIEKSNGKVKAELELRTRELNRLADETRERNEEAERIAREENGAVPSKMKKKHAESLKSISESLKRETERAEEERSKVENERNNLYDQYKKVMLRSISDKENEINLHIEKLRKDAKYGLEIKEKEYRLKAAKWLNVSLKRVEQKQIEQKESDLTKRKRNAKKASPHKF